MWKVSSLSPLFGIVPFSVAPEAIPFSVLGYCWCCAFVSGFQWEEWSQLVSVV